MLNFIKLYQAEYDIARNKYNVQINEIKKIAILLDIISVPFLLIAFYGLMGQNFLIKHHIENVHFSAFSIASILMSLLLLIACFIFVISFMLSNNTRYYDYQLTNLLKDWQIPNQKTFATQIKTANKMRYAIKAKTKPNAGRTELIAGVISVLIDLCLLNSTFAIFWLNKTSHLPLLLFLIFISLVTINIAVWYYSSVLIKQAKTIEQSIIAQLEKSL